MHIRRITQQHRRDFTAIYECEHCGEAQEGTGYDDDHFHRNAIPKMVCKRCQRIASSDYRPLQPKYDEGQTV